jgi:hypothetical protein
MTSWVCDFISTVTSIAPRIIKSGNSQISFFIGRSLPEKAAGSQARSPLLEIALVLVRFDYVASRIVNANHGIM